MTEFARIIMNDAMDIHGGRGIQMGPRNYLAQAYIAIPISITVEGANILTRNLILFGQGAVRCHPYLRDEMEAIAKKDMLSLDKLLIHHFFYSFKNLLKTFSFAFGLGYFWVDTPIKELAYHYRQISRLSAALALVTDFTLIILGGSLKRKERLSARLGDVLSYLYMASSVIRYVQDYPPSKEDRAYAQWGLDYCLYHIQYAFERFFNNFPKPFLARILKFIVFPLGRPYQLPTDKQDAQLVYPMTQVSNFRDRMTQDCYLGKNQEDATGRIELAFNQLMKTEAIRKKLKKLKKEGAQRKLTIEQQLKSALAEKILTSLEIEEFLLAKKLQQDAMQVDAF
jgi:hypothetical protein